MRSLVLHPLTLVLFSLWVWVGPGARVAAAEERPEVGRYAKVYKGGRG